MKYSPFIRRTILNVALIGIFLVSFQNCNKFVTTDVFSDQVVDLSSTLPDLPSMPGQLIVKFKNDASNGNFQTNSATNDTKLFVENLKSKYQAKKINSLSMADGTAGAQKSKINSLSNSNEMTNNYFIMQFADDADLAALIAKISKEPSVAYVEPNYIIRVGSFSPGSTPNDAYFQNNQKSFGQSNYDDLWGIKLIRAPQVWSRTMGDGILVAVIDSGVDYTHPDLAANMWADPVTGSPGFDFVENDTDPMDLNGHGTHVAGTIAGVGGNSIGVVGVAPNAKIMAIRALDKNGSGTIANLAQAVRYATDHGAKILNNSWGGPGQSQLINDAFEYAYSKGVTSLVAAGNDSRSIINNSVAANLNSVITVAATDPTDTKCDFSSFGYTVDISAPGGGATDEITSNILSTMPDNSHIANQGKEFKVAPGYYRLRGTSMATPHAAGAAALILALHPEFGPEDIKNVLKYSVDPVTTEDQAFIGTGRINLQKAISVNSKAPMARIDGISLVRSYLTITGVASNPGFSSYEIQVAPHGYASANEWKTLYSSRNAANGILLENFNIEGHLNDGSFTARLLVHGNGIDSEDRSEFKVDLMTVAQPFAGQIVRYGDKIDVNVKLALPYSELSVQYGEGSQPTSWTDIPLSVPTSGASLDGNIASWDTSKVVLSNTTFRGFYSIKVSQRNSTGARADRLVRTVYMDEKLKPGFPVKWTDRKGYFDTEGALVLDLDGDGKKEIVTLISSGYSKTCQGACTILRANRSDGSVYWERPLASVETMYDVRMVAGDIDNDSRPEIFFVGILFGMSDPNAKTQIHGFKYDGSPLSGAWPVSTSPITGKSRAVLTIADLHGTGKMNLISTGVYIDASSKNVYLYSFSVDISGNKKVIINDSGSSTSPFNLGFVGVTAPVFANVDNDSDLELVVPTNLSKDVSAYKLDGRLVAGWPYQTGDTIARSLLAVPNNSGTDDIIVPTYTNGIHIVKGGESKAVILRGNSIGSEIALGDMDDNGELDLVFHQYIENSPFKNAVGVYKMNGVPVSGWPLEVSYFWYDSPILGDVDGDSKPDIILASRGLYLDENGTPRDHSGGITAISNRRTPIDLNTSPMFQAILHNASGPVVVANLDTNRMSIIATTDSDSRYGNSNPSQMATPEQHNRSSLRVWETGVSFNSATSPWPMTSGGPSRNARIIRAPPVKSLLSLSKTGSGQGTVTSPSGINCGTTCSSSLEGNVTLTATAASGSTFAGWEGDCSGTPKTQSCTVRMTVAKNVVARFTALHKLSVTVTGKGYVSSVPAGIGTCFSRCESNYEADTPVELSATGQNGFVFGGWSGACSGVGVCRVTMSSAKEVGALFSVTPPTLFTLTVNSGVGGKVSSTPSGIENCSGECKFDFTSSVQVRLTATPTSGFAFDRWTGECQGTDSTCLITMSAAKNVQATFKALPASTMYILEGLVSGSLNSLSVSSTYRISDADWLKRQNEGKQICLYSVVFFDNKYWVYQGATKNTWEEYTGATSLCPVPLTSQQGSPHLVTAADVSSIVGFAESPIYIGYGIGTTPVTEMLSNNRFIEIGKIPKAPPPLVATDYELRGVLAGTRANLSFSGIYRMSSLHWSNYSKNTSDPNHKMCLYVFVNIGGTYFVYYGNNEWKPYTAGSNVCPLPIIQQQGSGVVFEGSVESIQNIGGSPVYAGYGIGKTPIDEMISSGRYVKIGDVP